MVLTTYYINGEDHLACLNWAGLILKPAKQPASRVVSKHTTLEVSILFLPLLSHATNLHFIVVGIVKRKHIFKLAQL